MKNFCIECNQTRNRENHCIFGGNYAFKSRINIYLLVHN